jgi:pectate lyase
MRLCLLLLCGTLGILADTYHVATLEDSNNPGTLRYGITSASTPRTILFDLPGIIHLERPLTISKPNLTIDGQHHPVTITGWPVTISKTHHVTLSHLRIRPGDTNCPAIQGDALSIDNATDILVDHLSVSWSIDEVLSVTHSDRVTVQWSIIAESLNHSCHEKGDHGYGSLIRYGNGTITFHHNLFAHNRSRNPRVGDNITLHFTNNVIYNYGFKGGQATYTGPAEEGTTKINYIANTTIPGPSTDKSRQTRTFTGGSTNTHLYQSGNQIDNQPATTKAFTGEYTTVTTPFPTPPATTSARQAADEVLKQAGANQPHDAIDQRILNDVKTGTGKIIDSPPSKL